MRKTLDDYFSENTSTTATRSVPLIWLAMATSALIAFLLSFVAAFLLYYDDIDVTILKDIQRERIRAFEAITRRDVPRRVDDYTNQLLAAH